jgi:hypothetical protein
LLLAFTSQHHRVKAAIPAKSKLVHKLKVHQGVRHNGKRENRFLGGVVKNYFLTGTVFLDTKNKHKGNDAEKIS